MNHHLYYTNEAERANFRRHLVTFTDAVSVFLDSHAQIFMAGSDRRGRRQELIFGRGSGRRYLVVMFIEDGERLEILGARPMAQAELKRHLANSEDQEELSKDDQDLLESEYEFDYEEQAVSNRFAPDLTKFGSDPWELYAPPGGRMTLSQLRPLLPELLDGVGLLVEVSARHMSDTRFYLCHTLDDFEDALGAADPYTDVFVTDLSEYFSHCMLISEEEDSRDRRADL